MRRSAGTQLATTGTTDTTDTARSGFVQIQSCQNCQNRQNCQKYRNYKTITEEANVKSAALTPMTPMTLRVGIVPLRAGIDRVEVRQEAPRKYVYIYISKCLLRIHYMQGGNVLCTHACFAL